MTSVFLTARWEHLVLLNYTVAPDVLSPLVPRGTELDAWQGEALVSLVGFRFADTRVRGVAVPGHRTFEEVNLRFYVRRLAPDGWRRGVVFIREIVPRAAIAFTARALYNERYVARPMSHRLEWTDGEPRRIGSVAYRWRDAGLDLGLRAAVGGGFVLPAPNSEAEFIVEHYWGYTVQRDGGTVEYRVEHPPWRVAPVISAVLEGDVGRFYGAPFDEALREPPHSSLVAEGSPVAVYSGQRIQ